MQQVTQGGATMGVVGLVSASMPSAPVRHVGPRQERCLPCLSVLEGEPAQAESEFSYLAQWTLSHSAY